MKAAQITQYNKNIDIQVNDVPMPKMGDQEFAHELSVLKEGGILLSLRTAPNKSYAKKMVFHSSNRCCFHWQD